MGQKQQGGRTAMPRVAGPPVLQRVQGPLLAGQRQSQDATANTAAGIVGTVAGLVANYFAPGSGGLAQAAANSTVRQQLNVINGRPLAQGAAQPWQDWPSILAGSAGGYLGGAAGGAIGGSGTAGQVGSQIGGRFGSAAGSYGGAQASQALYGGGQTRGQRIGTILGAILGRQAGAYGSLGALNSQSGG